jgi:hypothetical protein
MEIKNKYYLIKVVILLQVSFIGSVKTAPKAKPASPANLADST